MQKVICSLLMPPAYYLIACACSLTGQLTGAFLPFLYVGDSNGSLLYFNALTGQKLGSFSKLEQEKKIAEILKIKAPEAKRVLSLLELI